MPCELSILLLYRSTIGFDRLFNLFDQAAGHDGAPGYPPYNIERTGENAYRISIAVAGFAEADLSIEAKENTLTIRGEKRTSTDERTGQVLYQGIAARAFERGFQRLSNTPPDAALRLRL
jgi:molecular chaperone IbpA